MLDTSHFAFGVLAILVLVFANGFFVASEFALVTVRKTRIDQLIAEGHRGARTLRRVLNDPVSYIAATQLGITMASLGLGWVGEPALAAFIEPPFLALGSYVSTITAHTIAVVISFSIITALHIVLGELAPKTVALQHPESTALLVTGRRKSFMRVLWPFITALNTLGRLVVRAVGLKAPSGHSLVHSEEELKMLVTASQEAGVLEEEEEQMLHRVFGFSDLTAGQCDGAEDGNGGARLDVPRRYRRHAGPRRPLAAAGLSQEPRRHPGHAARHGSLQHGGGREDADGSDRRPPRCVHGARDHAGR
jgi:CBS domain containing-hemolysin-like protein